MKKIVSILLVLTLIFAGTTANADLDISAQSAILMDYNSGKLIYSLNENDKLAPASLTKIMTLLLAMEAISNDKIALSDKVLVSENASKTLGTTVYLDTGETQTVENLIKAISIRSANDAAVALAEHISGSEVEFVKLMNKKAETLGMTGTKFSNCSGLPIDNHYSTAYDIGLMSRELIRYKKIHEFLGIYMEDLKVGNSKTSIQTMVNTNRLIKDYDGANGIKTGHTNEAKYCISASAKRGDLQLIAVIMKAENSKVRFNEAKALLDFGFSNYKSILIGNKGDVFSNLTIEKGKEKSVDAVLERDSFILLPKDSQSNVEKLIQCPKSISSPVEEKQILGELIIKVEGKKVDSVNLIAKNSVGKGSLVDIFKTVWESYLFSK